MLVEKNLAGLARDLAAGSVTSVALAEAYLERIRSLDGEINAYITVPEELLLRQAAASDERRKNGAARSPYDGIPIAVKDVICTSGVRTTCASKMLENFIPPYDATAYRRLLDRGFLLLGKTNMDEFAMGSSTEHSLFGVTRNPWDLGRVPGGSSGGSAAAVAARMAPAALGSDTGGSVRQPASFCGVVGIKPTYGRVSRYGLVAYASSLDQVGAFGRTVDDAATLLAAISGPDARDATVIDREIDFTPGELADEVRGMVIGVPAEYDEGVEPEITERIRERLALLRDAGARIEELSLRYTEYAIPAYYLIATAEASSNLARYDGVRYGYRSPDSRNLAGLYLHSRSEAFGREVKRRIILGTFALSSGYYDAYYRKALKARQLITGDFMQAFSRVDAIVAPVAPTTAFRIGELAGDPLRMYRSDILTIPANLAGLPGVSVPVGLDSNGLPIGLQVLGSHFRERTILSLARVIEKQGVSHAPQL